MKLTIIESPFAGDVERNVEYLWRCCRHSMANGEAPYASHGFYTRYLDDNLPGERDIGIRMGFAWGRVADLRAVYLDLGLSSGMRHGIAAAGRLSQRMSLRWLKAPDHADHGALAEECWAIWAGEMAP